MFLLIGEFTPLYELMASPEIVGSTFSKLGLQLQHHAWNGLHFWDLIQPFFMFIVGLSLPFALKIRKEKGATQKEIFYHILKRSAILLFLGWALYCIGPGKITFRFQDVLAQIAFTYFIAFLISNKSFTFQIAVSFLFLVIADLIYRIFPIEGYNEPYVALKNFGTWLDLQYGGADLNGAWVSFNALPTTAHTIWGVLAGKLLMSEKSAMKKWYMLAGFGFALVFLGYGLDAYIPIIKRIATASFVIVSGGWAMLVLSLIYWLVDIKKWQGSWTLFFSIISMNSLFIYLFTHVGGATFIEHIYHPFFFSIFGNTFALITSSILVWASLCGICYWMYKKKIFVKI